MEAGEMLSVVVLTHNRAARCRDAVLHNAAALEGRRAEILVLNNGTEVVDLPGTCGGVPIRQTFMPRNLGAEARNRALEQAAGDILFFLDDDAYVEPGHIASLLACFRNHPATACAAFRVAGATGQESSLLPSVFHGCAAGIKKEALRRAGGYPAGYRYYVEEYHVSFRLRQAGYELRLAESATPVRHMRDAGGRSKCRILERLLHNNTRLFTAFLPGNCWGPAMCDMLQRYRLVARKEQARAGFAHGLATLPLAWARGLLERTPLDRRLFQEFALLPPLEKALTAAAARRDRPLVLLGTGRFPRIWLAALREKGWKVAGFLDSNACWRNQAIRHIPVWPALEAMPAMPSPPLLLAGLSSIGETAHWESLLDEKGWHPLPETANPAGKAEKITGNNAPLLCECCKIRFFTA